MTSECLKIKALEIKKMSKIHFAIEISSFEN